MPPVRLTRAGGVPGSVASAPSCNARSPERLRLGCERAEKRRARRACAALRPFARRPLGSWRPGGAWRPGPAPPVPAHAGGRKRTAAADGTPASTRSPERAPFESTRGCERAETHRCSGRNRPFAPTHPKADGRLVSAGWCASRPHDGERAEPRGGRGEDRGIPPARLASLASPRSARSPALPTPTPARPARRVPAPRKPHSAPAPRPAPAPSRSAPAGRSRATLGR